MQESSNDERSLKEKRIREITLIYYSRPDIKKALFDFSINRECVPRYFEGFGKRPDSFQYENDILEHVRKGATSFHCSEELWSDPLEISTEMTRPEFDELRSGWDLLLDIDSPYFDYSKTYAEILVKVLKKFNVENIGVKFSGSKGFHVIIPWKSFPKEVYGQKTKDMFPEWPRIICLFLTETIKKELDDALYEKFEQGESLKDLAEKMGKSEEDLVSTECLSCHKPALKKELVTWTCPNCRNEVVMIRKTKRIPKCPNEDCRKDLVETSVKESFACDFCNINSLKNPELFKKIIKMKHIEADLILVASRHLFRMPYSLHEKTSLASVVVDKDKIKDFSLLDAKPFKVTVKNFYPEPRPEEAKTLLLSALDWKEQNDKLENSIQESISSSDINKSPDKTKTSKDKKDNLQKIQIQNPQENIYPPCIRILMKGLKQDGRKRGLFILINFFKSLGVSDTELEKRVYDWNNKNAIPLKKGYIMSQLTWYKRNKSLMPPNCDKPNYKDLAICKPDELCKSIKNPVNYAVKKYFRSNK